MITWSCKSFLFGLAAFALSACDIPLLQAPFTEAGPVTALAQAEMLKGAVTLVPPSGYCIDKSSLEHTFALMARCDTLGVKNATLDAPLGLITVSLAPERAANLPTALDILSASETSDVIEEIDVDGFQIIRANASPPFGGVSFQHWRATAAINQYSMSIAFFAPDGSAALGPRGPEMLLALLGNSQDASTATHVAQNAPETDTP